MLTPLLKSQLPQFRGRLLVVLCSYRGGIGNPSPFSFAGRMPGLGRIAQVFDRLSLLSLRQFIASNRDFFANVRSMDYQVGLLEEALQLGEPAGVTIRVDQALADDAAYARLQALGRVELRQAGDLFGVNEPFDNVLVIYPDALGLGWKALESRLPKGRAYGLNGRRRVFSLDSQARQALAWRRILANTRITELLAAVAIVPLAAGLAVWDALRGKT